MEMKLFLYFIVFIILLVFQNDYLFLSLSEKNVTVY